MEGSPELYLKPCKSSQSEEYYFFFFNEEEKGRLDFSITQSEIFTRQIRVDFEGLNRRSSFFLSSSVERESRAMCIARVKLVDTKSTGSDDDELSEMDVTPRGSPRADVNGGEERGGGGGAVRCRLNRYRKF